MMKRYELTPKHVSMLKILFLLFISSQLLVGENCSHFLQHPYLFLMGENALKSETPWDSVLITDKKKLIKTRKYFENALKDSRKPLSGIPKIFHIIWIGPKEFPQDSVKNIASFQQHHPDWAFFFWTDRIERQCPLPGLEKKLLSTYDFASLQPCINNADNYGLISDIMRQKILFDMGGIYIDHDIFCIQSFESLASLFDFFASYQVSTMYHKPIQSYIPINNCCFGSSPNHPILKKAIELTISRWNGVEAAYANELRHHRILAQVFSSFSIAVEECAYTTDNHDIILPTCSFFSMRFTKKAQKIVLKNGLVYGLHLFSGTWNAPDAYFPSRKILDKKLLKKNESSMKRKNNTIE